MNHEHQEIGLAAAFLADRLPISLMLLFAEIIAGSASMDWNATSQMVLQKAPTPAFRKDTARFLDWCVTRAPGVSREAIAVAIVTAAKSAQNHRQNEAVEIVWTGPETATANFRQTEQALLEVVNTAKSRLTVVSFAVYRIPRIQEALIAAIARGVTIRLILETPNRIEGKGTYDTLRSLGVWVAMACDVLYWPQENRERDANGKHGSLHVKCAVADGHRLFLSSANLTEYAFTINMELGVLMTGGRLPGRVDEHFDRLIEAGVFERV